MQCFSHYDYLPLNGRSYRGHQQPARVDFAKLPASVREMDLQKQSVIARTRRKQTKPQRKKGKFFYETNPVFV